MTFNIVLVYFDRLHQFEALIVLLVCGLREDTALGLVLTTGLVVTIEEGSVPGPVYEHSIGSASSGSHGVKNSWIKT